MLGYSSDEYSDCSGYYSSDNSFYDCEIDDCDEKNDEFSTCCLLKLCEAHATYYLRYLNPDCYYYHDEIMCITCLKIHSNIKCEKCYASLCEVCDTEEMQTKFCCDCL